MLLGREPRADFDVVVRSDSGDPVVIRNAPLLADGTPMPTRYWLVAPDLVRGVSRLEADGGGGTRPRPSIRTSSRRRTTSTPASARPRCHQTGLDRPRSVAWAAPA